MSSENSKQGTLSGKNFFWYVLSGLLVIVVLYTLFKGNLLESFSFAGVELKFNSPTSNKEIAGIDSSVIEERQQQLQQELADYVQMEDSSHYDTNSVSDDVVDVNVTGTYISNDGMSYILQQNGLYVNMQEISPVYGITAAGQGMFTEEGLQINYNTILGTQGTMLLNPAENGLQLAGSFVDHTSGVSGRFILTRQ